MAKQTILIIRHGEKPEDVNDPNLSPKGVERAAALAKAIPKRCGKPDYLFASAPSRHSMRPLETIMPLAESLDMVADLQFADQDYAPLAKLLTTNSRYAGKLILVCWHHGHIPDLAEALGVTTCPQRWPSTCFDHMWHVIRHHDGRVDFADDLFAVLPGDE